ncbi:hypothetical protein IH982_03070 [Patescibacteria group bacterium]|nr:hypothetical protein [Patescibacteria group bacterium]
MLIGVSKENREKTEKRVLLLPQFVQRLVKDGHTVRVEKDAGRKLKFTNEEYKRAGAIISSKKEVYSSDIVLRIRIPTLDELDLMKKNSVLICMVHRDTHPEMVAEFKKRRINVIELNEIKNSDGKRLVEAFEISGSEGIKTGFKLFEKIYKKTPENIVIMGYGNLAIPAIQTACKFGASVTVLGEKQTSKKNMGKHLKNAEVVVNATLRKAEEVGKYLITKEQLVLLNKESLVLDLSADPISCIETCRPTTLDKPYYSVGINGREIYHMCIYSLPGLAPLKCSKRYSKQVLPFVRLIANLGLSKAIRRSSSLKRAFIPAF